MKAHKLTELALLTAVSLIIFIIELRIPNLAPIPGVKLGLANIITVYAVFRYTPAETVMIVTVRLLLGAIFAGTPVTFIYSVMGAVFCLLGMLSVKSFIPKNFIWLCSMLGAVFHNIGQICAAFLVMRTPAVIISYLPVLLFSGCIAGLFTGLCAQMLVNRLHQ